MKHFTVKMGIIVLVHQGAIRSVVMPRTIDASPEIFKDGTVAWMDDYPVTFIELKGWPLHEKAT